MQRHSFSYDLPQHLIANEPTPERTGSRLLVLDSENGAIQHRQFSGIIELLRPEDLLVFNNTKVIPARLHGHKASGGKVQILLERCVGETRALAQIRASKSPKAGTTISLTSGETIEVTGRDGEFFVIESQTPLLDLLERLGEIPLPPYIERAAEDFDKDRYQTVYAREPGAVAAPTAGLHFDQALLQRLEDRGIDSAFVTLHVGAGTFQPVRVDDIQQHRMHVERMVVDEVVCEKVRTARERGGRVVAVGTTSVRALESAAKSGTIQATAGETDIFIYPPYQFKVVDALITNFHLPESTLLMLVSAFAGREHTLAAYRAAVAEHYRFFSYGDAMFVTRGIGSE